MPLNALLTEQLNDVFHLEHCTHRALGRITPHLKPHIEEEILERIEAEHRASAAEFKALILRKGAELGRQRQLRAFLLQKAAQLCALSGRRDLTLYAMRAGERLLAHTLEDALDVLALDEELRQMLGRHLDIERAHLALAEKAFAGRPL